MKEDMHSKISIMDAIDSRVIFRGPLVGILPILLPYVLSFSAAVMSQLQLWHFCGLVSPESMDDLPSQVL